MNPDIIEYHHSQNPKRRELCELLAKLIASDLPEATSKVWHGAPVWFINGNPIVGYDVLKDSVRLLFWSGQSFEEPSLQPTGKFRAAEARYTAPEQVKTEDLARWLKKSKEIQWDYKNIVKHKGILGRLA